MIGPPFAWFLQVAENARIPCFGETGTASAMYMHGKKYAYECNIDVRTVNRPWAGLLSCVFQAGGLVRQNMNERHPQMYTALLITSILILGYLVYVMLYPEKF